MQRNFENGVGQHSPQTATIIDDAQVREAMALTAGMISCVDDAVGSITSSLRDTG